MGECHSDESDGLAKAIWADIINYRANLSRMSNGNSPRYRL